MTEIELRAMHSIIAMTAEIKALAEYVKSMSESLGKLTAIAEVESK